MAFYDRAAKWLMKHQGASLLWLAGEEREIESYEAIQAEVVMPSKLPDGLFDVKFASPPSRGLHLLEAFVYSDRRAEAQIVRDAELVHADRGELPEIFVMTLHRRGRYRIPNHTTIVSDGGNTSLKLKWKTRELWRIPAAKLLARDDPGLIPWVPLCGTRRSTKRLLAECRQRIETQAPPEHQEALLVTTHVYANLRFGDVDALKILGDRKMLAETPLIQKFIEQGREEGIEQGMAKGNANAALEILTHRFRTIPKGLISKLNQVSNFKESSKLPTLALSCKDLKEFEKSLS